MNSGRQAVDRYLNRSRPPHALNSSDQSGKLPFASNTLAGLRVVLFGRLLSQLNADLVHEGTISPFSSAVKMRRAGRRP